MKSRDKMWLELVEKRVTTERERSGEEFWRVRDLCVKESVCEK